jgi:SEC-C motif
MGSVGRNEPCPCGSGRKYKKCCLGTGSGGAPYTGADREAALQRLLRSIHPEDIEEARQRFWGEHLPLRDRWKDRAPLEMAENVFQFWMFFDELDEGETLADFLLDEERDIAPGERRYLEMGRASSMRLYEVVGVEPGAGLTLRDVLQGSEIRVRERAGSRSVHTWDLVAARVMQKGVSGQPEIDGGMLPIQSRLRGALIEHLEQVRDELDEAEAREARAYALFGAWIGPGMPKMVNYDGDPMLLTTVHFDVLDEGALATALDGDPELSRDDDAKVWSWVGKGRERDEIVSRAFLRIAGGRLEIQTNSRERGDAARSRVGQIAGASVKYRVTEHQDLEQAALALEREGGPRPATLPEELREPAREAVADMLQQHYEKWLDEPVPALDGSTPRAAADTEALRPRLAAMIEDLEGMYERALAEGAGAFDPTWMWEELGLEDLARGRSRKQGVPRLPHEVIAELEPDLVEVAAEIGDRARRTSRDDVTRVIDRQEIEGDLGFHRLVRESVRDAKEDGAPEPAASARGALLASWIGILANFELHLRKLFWVDEGLAWMLGATQLDVTGDALRPPFASFALVFTDRYALGLMERLLAVSPSTRLRGRILSVLTVYVTSQRAAEEGPTEMRIALGADARDGGWPELVVCNIVVRPDAGIAEVLRTVSPGDDEGEEIATVVASPPLRGLLGLVFNAILYATGGDAEVVPGDPRGDAAPAPRRRRSGVEPRSDSVFHLPGKIDITSLRQLKRVRRGASEVQALRRCMVRGHWRRAARGWKDERPRWIKPHWRGPSAAAIVEREYRLT